MSDIYSLDCVMMHYFALERVCAVLKARMGGVLLNCQCVCDKLGRLKKQVIEQFQLANAFGDAESNIILRACICNDM